MPEAAQSSILGRCPSCGRLVTLPAEARATRVGCPVCRHQARGAAFAGVEAPLPVFLVSEDAERNVALPSNGFDHDVARNVARNGAAAAEARTHLILDVPCLDDEDARDPDTARGLGAARASVEDDAQTHLVLSLTDVEDDGGASSDDPRTRLMLGPLSLRTGKNRPLERGAAWLRPLVPSILRLSVWLEEALHGRWLWALGAVAVVCGFVAPGLDYLATGGRSTHGPFTFTCVLCSFAGLFFARLNGLRSDDGKWDPRIAGTRVRGAARLYIESFDLTGDTPPYLQRLMIGQLLALVGLGWLLMSGFFSGLDLVSPSNMGTSPLWFVGGLPLLAAVGEVRHALRSAPVHMFSLQQSGDSLAAVAELPPIIDLSEPLPEAFTSGTTTLHRSLIALSQWRSRSWPDEALYRAALERHLQQHLPQHKIERERWVGRSLADGVVDLVIDGVVVIGVTRGFHDSCAERAIGQMRRYARTWAGKPMILAIFEAPRAAVLESSRTASLVALHKELALLTVRMPTRR